VPKVNELLCLIHLAGLGFRVHSFPLKEGFTFGEVSFFLLFDIVDEPMNSSHYAQWATTRCPKTVQFSSVNREPLAQTWLSSPVA
jgi:hypothetical protein